MTLNRIAALAMVHGPRVGLEALLVAEPVLAGHPRIAQVRAHLLEQAGDVESARAQYALAARTTLNLAERHYLEGRAADTRR